MALSENQTKSIDNSGGESPAAGEILEILKVFEIVNLI